MKIVFWKWWVAGVVAVLLSIAGEAMAANTYSGGLSNRFYRFDRPASLTNTSGQAVYFHAVYFTVKGSAPGSVTGTVSGVGFTPRVHFYQNGTFDPYAPLNNLWWMGSGTVTATNLAHGIEIPHLAIVSGSSATDVGSFTLTLSGPGVVEVATNNDSALVIRTQPQNASILSGQTAAVRVWASGRQPQKWQWYWGPKPAATNAPDPAKAIPGATNQTYFTPALTQTTNYWCLITGTNTSPTSARSSLATVNVSVAPATFNGSLTPQHDTWNRMTTNNISSGQNCFFEVHPFRVFSAGTYIINLTNVGFAGSINIYNGKFFPATPAVNFFDTGVYADLPGALRYTNIYQPGDYELVVSSKFAGQGGTFSGGIVGPSTVQMLPRPTFPVLLNLPRDRTILTNTTATMSFSVEGAIPRTNQWFKGIPPDASMPIAGATGKSYTTPILPNVGTNWYWVRVANSYGATTSGPVRVRVVDGPIQFSGKLRPGNKVFRKSNGMGGMQAGLSYYKTYFFEAPITGSYTCTVNGASVSVYNQIFLTNNPNVNLSLLPGSGTFLLNVAAPSTYIFVLSVTQGTFSAYSGTIVGPGGALVNELPAPAFNPQPAPTNQFLWRNEDPAPIIGNSIPVDASWSWWRGASPGLPIDGTLAITNLTTRTNDQPASVTAEPTNLWFWARIDGSYGYDDSELCMLEVSPPPRFMVYPTSRSIVYGNLSNITTLVTNVPFALRWYQTNSPVQTNTVQTNVIQGYGPSYIRAVSRTNTLPLLNVGSYSYWINATNPSGITNGPTFTITITKRPLFVAITTPQGLTPYDGLPHGASATATDLNPGGPAVPNPMRIDLTYQLLPSGPVVTNLPVNAGTYQVIATVVHSNYMGSATNSYTISKSTVTARADNKSRLVGTANPPLTVTLSGFVNGETSAVIDTPPTATTTATVASAIGQYPISASGGTDNNYTFNYVSGTLTVLGEPVVVAWASDFSTNASLSGTLGGSAFLSNGVLQLTTTNANQNGHLIIGSPGRPLRALYASFDLLIGGGNVGEGFSFNYAPNATNTATPAQEGFGNGLSILVDTFNNGGEIVPNIGIKFGGVIIAEQSMPAVRNNTLNRFVIDVTSSGVLTLKFLNTVVTNIALPGWSPLPEFQFSLGARNTTARDNHVVDNLLIGERASGVLLSTAPPTLALELRPAFADIPALTYSVASNSNPAFVSAAAMSTGAATVTTASNLLGTATVWFRATNASMDAIVPFTVTTLQPEIVSISSVSNLHAELKLAGPANARFYLQQSSALISGDWQTIAYGILDGTGTATISAQPFTLANTRGYRVIYTR